ncbi:heme NO-binding domain-containing protein [Limibacter armeniacum]|uniref:heme NO-binding domain-containing protein n=1 Tax=Limibacter armeniacum TaxID=466084 RepID=UPI002FE5F9C8
MKGIVFTQLLEMVEEQFGYDIADKVILDSELPNDGIYTAVGTYPHEELMTILERLQERTDISIPQLMYEYGKHLFGVFTSMYSHFIKDVDDLFEFLQQIDGHIHKEVLKLYPDAELPKFRYELTDEGNTLLMYYSSQRKMADFAEGLLMGAITYFGEKVMVNRENLDDGTNVKFVIQKQQ